MPSKKRKNCEHLNVETLTISGVEMAMCKDCKTKVNPEDFQKTTTSSVSSASTLQDGKNKSSESEKTAKDGLKEVYSIVVDGLVTVPGLAEPFYPVSHVQPGDRITVYRAK